ncbi:MAG: DUF1553 domain-containing protein, partial [Planctomycetes bacterium]|nr:DUF1553 domain-containing protein [Planctomycetota bacterium]
DAYDKLVDKLLESPHYGERWGRHWMDVWRYSDWAGYGQEIRQSQRHIWRWRDWIVESLNRDKPYDQMIVEMLAGDELAPTDPDTLRATGFLARSWFKFNRNVWLDNVVEHTSKAFLGITLNCARCHEHKYDPIEQQEYYQFRAFFEPYNVRTDRVPGQPDLVQDGLPRVYDAEANAQTFLFARGDEAQPVKEKALQPAVPAFLHPGEFRVESVALPATAHYPGLRPFVQQETLAADEAAVAKSRSALDQANRAVEQAKLRLARLAQPPAETEKTNNRPEPFLADKFAAARPDAWEIGPGEWKYEGGRLMQSLVGNVECRLRSVREHPRDFSARFRFKITGGDQWRSVGLSFDVAEGQSHGVYLSAYAGGPKLQIYHTLGGTNDYPAAGTKSLPVSLGREYVLGVDVRDQLVNVSVDGSLQLAYRLPRPRTPGRLTVWAFDATAEFMELTVDELPVDARLAEDATGHPVAAVTSVAEAEAAIRRTKAEAALAAKQLLTAEAKYRSAQTRIPADNARFAQPPDPRADELSAVAARAEREATAREAEENLLRAEQQLADTQANAKPDNAKSKDGVASAEKKLNEAREKHKAAQSALASTDSKYTPLSDVYPTTSTGRRLALTRWIAGRENPLTARVAVNHVWMRHFGRPLVPTVFDFGMNGQPPTHPELLDWLAVEFMEHGWNMKRLHRLIVTSNTYRMASQIADCGLRIADLTSSDTKPDSPELQLNDPQSAIRNPQSVDPDNIYLWRQNPRRMEAEIVRDSVLHVAGQLDATLGGPDIDHNLGLTSRRRSIYFRTAYEKQMTFLTLFDQASVTECYRRSESVVPQQALALANSQMAQEQSRLLARKLVESLTTASGMSVDELFVNAAFETVLGRCAEEAEMSECLGFLARQADLLANPTRLSAVQGGAATTVKPSGDARQRARENLVLVLLNHHEFVTIR